MNLTNKKVIHSLYGEGIIESVDENRLTVNFNGEIKKFTYPDAFEKHLKFKSAAMQKAAQTDMENKNYEMKQQQAERIQSIKEKMAAAPLKKKTGVSSSGGQRKKTSPKPNVAFKCNFCNGGASNEHIGFCGVCSDALIKYNIETAHHNWCCDEDAPCHRYYDGEIDRDELDEYCDDDSFVCYESQMLIDWTAYSGFALTKENKEKPMKMNNVQINSLALLTTRQPYTKETDRFIFGVFLVEDVFEGDSISSGYVKAGSKYKIELKPSEAYKMKFWKYYANERAPHNMQWGQGLHRYLYDIQAAQILRDIAKIKAGTPDEQLANEFFEHYCNVNGLNKDDIPDPTGGLVINEI